MPGTFYGIFLFLNELVDWTALDMGDLLLRTGVEINGGKPIGNELYGLSVGLYGNVAAVLGGDKFLLFLLFLTFSGIMIIFVELTAMMLLSTEKSA